MDDDHFIEFEWWRDTKTGAFEVHQPELQEVHERSFVRPPKKIRWIGVSPLSRYRPLKLQQYVVSKLLEVVNEATALQFVQLCGFPFVAPQDLTDMEDAYRSGATVESILDFAAAIREFLLSVAESPARAFGVLSKSGGQIDVLVEAALIPDQKHNSVRMRYSVRSLRDAVILQQSLLLAGGAKYRACKQCQRPFAVGPGTKRTLQSKFCDEACKIKWHSLKRSEGK